MAVVLLGSSMSSALRGRFRTTGILILVIAGGVALIAAGLVGLAL